MSSTTFESEIKTIHASAEAVFCMLSDLANLEKVKDKLPADKVQNMEFDSDSCSVTISPIGRIGFRITDRDPNRTIKFEAEKSPLPLSLWVQLKETAPQETKVKITVKAELSFVLKGMVSSPLQEGVDKLADMLTLIPY